MVKSGSEWKTVKFEEIGANVANIDFEGLAGFEECHDYSVTTSKSNRRNRKRKSKSDRKEKKKPKIDSNGFMVENVSKNVSKLLKPPTNIKNETKEKKKKKKGKNKNTKSTNGEQDLKSNLEHIKSENIENENGIRENCDNNFENMQAWSSFGISELITKALAERGFQKPTLIQELTLPPAMHGKRDILGAAETGSGKTLAFGIPIINGILHLKERGENESVAVKRDIYSFNTSENKIVNINKLSSEERAEFFKSQRKRGRTTKKTPKKTYSTSEVDGNREDSDDENGEDSDDENEEDSDDENKENSDDESDDVNDDIVENEDDVSENDEGSEISDLEDDAIASNSEDDSDKESSEEEEEKSENDLSDSEGIGCVKVIDDIEPIESNESKIIKLNLKPLYALILTPTRELAIQVKNHLVAAAKYTDIRVAVVVGGMAQVKQERILNKCPEIVVATPGRLWEMIQQGNDHLSQISDIRYLAIDETDRMIEHGHFEELHLILEKINDDDAKKARRQNFVFSATLTMVHDIPFYLKVKKFTKRGKMIRRKFEKLTTQQKLKKVIEILGITNPKVVDITEQNRGSSNTLTECRITCLIDEKDYYLYYVLKKHPGRTIVFCNSIGCVKRLAQLFSILQCRPLPLHASMQQRQRLKNLDRFTDDPQGLLIATDVAARGLDIPNVEHVIHYQVPRTAENYVHRSGRTARANKEGITILIMEASEVQNYVKLCRTLSKSEDLPHFPINETLLCAIKQRVNMAREIDQLELRMRKTNSEVGWYEKTMREMDIVLDENEMPKKIDKSAEASQKSALASKRKQLNALLASRLFPKGFSFKYPTMNTALQNDMDLDTKQNAVEVMKSAMESGLVKKRSTKNEAHLKLGGEKLKKNKSKPIGKLGKNKLKKMKKQKSQ